MIQIALLIIALTGGAFLFGWTRKNDGGAFLKIVSYVVMLLSVIAIVVAVSHHMCRERCDSGACGKEDHCPMSGKSCGSEMGMKAGKDCCVAGKDSADVNEVGGHIESKGQAK